MCYHINSFIIPLSKISLIHKCEGIVCCLHLYVFRVKDPIVVLFPNMLRHVWLPEMEDFISGWGKGLVLEDIRIVVNGIEKNLGLE